MSYLIDIILLLLAALSVLGVVAFSRKRYANRGKQVGLLILAWIGFFGSMSCLSWLWMARDDRMVPGHIESMTDSGTIASPTETTREP